MGSNFNMVSNFNRRVNFKQVGRVIIGHFSTLKSDSKLLKSDRRSNFNT